VNLPEEAKRDAMPLCCCAADEAKTSDAERCSPGSAAWKGLAAMMGQG
jgi:hypothetical protein